jgi:hypothetical protein
MSQLQGTVRETGLSISNALSPDLASVSLLLFLCSWLRSSNRFWTRCGAHGGKSLSPPPSLSSLLLTSLQSLLHSSLRQRTPAELTDATAVADEDGPSSLPHQIRGFLSSFLQVQPMVPSFPSSSPSPPSLSLFDFSLVRLQCSSFPHCTACSEAIVRALYPSATAEGLNFSLLEQICEDSTVLEVLSGVNELTAGLDDIDLLEDDGEEDF